MHATPGMLLAATFGLTLVASNGLAVTQEFLDQECRKTDIRVVGTDAALSVKPAKLIIAYSCGEFGPTVEYESLHFICPHHGPRTIAAAVYDVQGQTYLRDMDEMGNYRSVVKLEEIQAPSCDLPL
jgi:hypothetical protein